ncbi:DUF7266 family protein [Natronobiforma cellulositropha]|uniref:DUF7266 family protein n=1 Tax=Natronobiforma cellulositropha TaxID=1679076 RepID=UPI0021D5D8FE|nr:hypothetical protein [Natronobiforma cellulositropha]
MMRSRFGRDDRAVSIAVTHVLTIAITAVLITGLMIGAGTLIDGEKERGAESSLTTIGERLSGELSSVDRLSDGSDDVVLRVSHPRSVSGSGYSIDVGDDDDCTSPLVNQSEHCLLLESSGEDVEVQVPVAVDADLDTDASARGGPITFRSDGSEITMESGH